ncbi:MAG: hypothetical protein WD059_12920 [Balneolaceae bacterium]
MSTGNCKSGLFSNVNAPGKGILGGFIAVIVGFLSRPCCSLPFFLALFGMGSGGMVELLLPYRHLFLALSLISFSVSGWMIFRVQGAMFNKIFFVISVLATFLFLFQPQLLFNL